MRTPNAIKIDPDRTFLRPRVAEDAQVTLSNGVRITRVSKKGRTVGYTAKAASGRTVRGRNMQFRDADSGDGFCLFCTIAPDAPDVLVCTYVPCPPSASKKGGGSYHRPPLPHKLGPHGKGSKSKG